MCVLRCVLRPFARVSPFRQANLAFEFQLNSPVKSVRDFWSPALQFKWPTLFTIWSEFNRSWPIVPGRALWPCSDWPVTYSAAYSLRKAHLIRLTLRLASRLYYRIYFQTGRLASQRVNFGLMYISCTHISCTHKLCLKLLIVIVNGHHL